MDSGPYKDALEAAMRDHEAALLLDPQTTAGVLARERLLFWIAALIRDLRGLIGMATKEIK